MWYNNCTSLADLATRGKVNTMPLEGRVMTSEMLTDHSESGKLNLAWGRHGEHRS